MNKCNTTTPPAATKTTYIILSEDMLSDMMNSDYREYIKTLSSSKYGVDLKLKPKTDEPAASFRKLTVD